ncbi:hypothetical protein [Nocardia gamkensis]|uniref:hypothetical protein n=1 Tax=Nocardia gamkensis TaxID=352869 RepID=UPI0007C7B91C|nr:hypothetical protein [Nocardia gamkensis]NQE66024.1 hypothetical protein [Nocardia gamkensis]
MAAGYSAAGALLVTAPLLGPGYLLLRDAVSTPRSYPTDSALGLGDAAPRAVPQDALLAVLSAFVDGGLLVKAILVVALWAAAYGAAALARELLRASLGPQLVAATVALWNPYVAERLLQGHWSLLAGYAALPWTALAAHRLRTTATVRRRRRLLSNTSANPPNNLLTPAGRSSGTPDDVAPPDPTEPSRSAPTSAAGEGGTDRPSVTTAQHEPIRTASTWAALAGSLAAAGLTPTGALLAGATAFALVQRRQLPGTLVLWLAASAPWLAATVLSGSGAAPSDPAGIAAFAARAEPGLGTLGSLAGLGGIWNAEAVPHSRTTPLAAIGTAALLAIVALGLRAVATGGADPDNRRARRALLLLAAGALLFPALGATAGGMAAMEWLVAHVPGAGLLRDTQKYVALAMPAYALCAAAGCAVTARRLSSVFRRASAGRRARAHPAVTSTAAAVFVALLVLPLYDLAWGVGGAVRPVHYPAGWQLVAARIDGPGDVAVLPGGMFRKFRYSGRAPVLDPAPRMLPEDVLQTGELPVRGRTVSGEGARAREVEAALLHGGSAAEPARLGVGWVLVERTTLGPLGGSASTLASLERVYEDADLALYRVPGVVEHGRSTTAHRWTAAAAHLLWGALLVAGPLAALGIRARFRRRPRT